MSAKRQLMYLYGPVEGARRLREYRMTRIKVWSALAGIAVSFVAIAIAVVNR